MLTDEIKGKPISELALLGKDDVLENLGIEISPARLKCALLSLDTLRRALASRVAWQASTDSDDSPAPATSAR